MVLLERVLRMPPWAVTAIWLVGVTPSPQRYFYGDYWRVTVAPIYSPAVLTMLVILFWLYALYSASVRRTPANADWMRFVFPIAAMLYGATLCFAHIAYVWQGDPPGILLVTFSFLLLPTVIGLIASMALAANSLSDFETSVTPQRKESWHPFLPVIFLGIGIWFIHRRIQAMLEQPILSESPHD